MMSVTFRGQRPRMAAALLTFCKARQASSSAEGKPERVSSKLSFRPAFDSALEAGQRPLVLVYCWLVAKARHIHKYSDFYLGKGFDVLNIKVSPHELLWPKSAQLVAGEVADFTMDRCPSQPVLAHGFSVGCYIFAETLVKIHSEPQKYGELGRRIIGQVLDSPVDFNHVPFGFANAMTNIVPLQKVIRASIEGYTSVFAKQVKVPYEKAQRTATENELRVPTLMLYSNKDPVGLAKPIEEVIHKMKAKNIPTYGKCWPDSPHVSHFAYYPIEYIAQLNSFLQTLGYGQEQHIQKEQGRQAI